MVFSNHSLDEERSKGVSGIVFIGKCERCGYLNKLSDRMSKEILEKGSVPRYCTQCGAEVDYHKESNQSH